MSREWKPGQPVAFMYGGTEYVGIIDVDGRPYTTDKRAKGIPATVGTVRPLVTIDPEDREAVERLLVTYGRQFTDWTPETDTNVTRLQSALREFANPTLPKPDEPTGLGAVVEDREGNRWSRIRSRPEGHACWQRDESAVVPVQYRAVDVVRVLSEGVQ